MRHCLLPTLSTIAQTHLGFYLVRSPHSLRTSAYPMKQRFIFRSYTTPSTAQFALHDARHHAQSSTGRRNTVQYASSSSSTIIRPPELIYESSSNAATSTSVDTARDQRRGVRLGRLAKRAGMRVVHASQSSLAKINPLSSLKMRLFDMLTTKAALKASKNDDRAYVFVNPPRLMPQLPGPQRGYGPGEGEPGNLRASSSSFLHECTHQTSDKGRGSCHLGQRNDVEQPADHVPIFHGWAMYCGTHRPPKLVPRTHWDDAVAQHKARRAELAHNAAVAVAEAYETRLRHAVEEVIRECEEERMQSSVTIVQEHGAERLGFGARRRPSHLKIDTRPTVEYIHDADGRSTSALSTPADTIGSSGPPSRTVSAHFDTDE